MYLHMYLIRPHSEHIQQVESAHTDAVKEPRLATTIVVYIPIHALPQKEPVLSIFGMYV